MDVKDCNYLGVHSSTEVLNHSSTLVISEILKHDVKLGADAVVTELDHTS